MGTHISKVKSVDLDMWTPEQMEVSFPPRVNFMRPLIRSLVHPKMGQ